jgi:hypothetical protein
MTVLARMSRAGTIREDAFIAFWVPMGKGRGAGALPASLDPPASALARALPYPPGRQYPFTSSDTERQAPHRCPQSDKRIPSKKLPRSLCRSRKNGHAPGGGHEAFLSGFRARSMLPLCLSVPYHKECIPVPLEAAEHESKEVRQRDAGRRPPGGRLQEEGS